MNYPRHAKPTNMWGSGDLNGYNIEVVSHKDAQSFFGVSELPVPQHISPVIWNNALAPVGPLSKEEKTYFALLKDVMKGLPDGYGASNDFFHFLLGYLGYDDDATHVLHVRKEMNLLVCGEYLDATTDISLLEEIEIGYYSQYLLLVQQNTFYIHESDEPYAPLVAKAIAAFRINNALRESSRPLLTSQMFPGLTVFGTSLVFYKITVTPGLVRAVRSGIFPDEKTVVHEFRPRLDNMHYAYEGMVSVENRRFLLQCLEAFKKFIVVPNRQIQQQSLN